MGCLLRGLGNSSIRFVVWVLRWWAWEDGKGGRRTSRQWQHGSESNDAASAHRWSSLRPIKPSVNLSESVRPLNTSTKLTPQRYHPAKPTWHWRRDGSETLVVRNGCLWDVWWREYGWRARFVSAVRRWWVIEVVGGRTTKTFENFRCWEFNTTTWCRSSNELEINLRQTKSPSTPREIFRKYISSVSLFY